MFPYFDENPSKTKPYVTFSLIGLNVLAFLLFNFRPDFANITFRYGFIPAKFSFFTMLTSMFLHGSFAHLLGNMWFLWLFGDNIEDKFGRRNFLGFYLLGGMVASFVHMALSSAVSEVPCIGASGAVSAVMGAYFVLFPRAKIRMMFFFGFMPIRFKLNAFFFLGFWAILQFFSGALASSAQATTGIAYGAHIGGFLVGILGGFLRKFQPPADV